MAAQPGALHQLDELVARPAPHVGRQPVHVETAGAAIAAHPSSRVPGGPVHFATPLNTVIAETARCSRSPASAARVMTLRSAASSRKLRGRALTLNCVQSRRDAGTDAPVVW